MRPKLRLFYHLDHLGTPRAITSATGGLVSIANYFPFGEELNSSRTPLLDSLQCDLGHSARGPPCARCAHFREA